MIRINLLPHREEKRTRRKKQFAVLAGITGVLGLLLAGAVYAFLNDQVSQQQANVKYMQDEIAKLDKEIEEIKKIREETASLLAKKQVVESLQSNRSEPVQLLDQLLRQLPDGVYLKSIQQRGAKVNLTGYAQSNARVSTLMRNLGASPYLENPELVEIKGTPAPDKTGNRVNEFNMNISIKRAQPEGRTPGKAAPAAPAPGAAPKPAGAK